jgi:hypothetical protein
MEEHTLRRESRRLSSRTEEIRPPELILPSLRPHKYGLSMCR